MILTLDAGTADFFVHEEILLFFFFFFIFIQVFRDF